MCQVKLCAQLLTSVISEHLTDELLIIKHYINLWLLYTGLMTTFFMQTSISKLLPLFREGLVQQLPFPAVLQSGDNFGQFVKLVPVNGW